MASDCENINNREFNFLRDSDKAVRKKTLEKMKKEMKIKQKELDREDYQKVVIQSYKQILKCFHDPSERCREIATEIIYDFINFSNSPEDLLSYIVPVFLQRLGCPETIETSEEVRLLQIQTLNILIEKCGDHLVPYLDDLLCIFSKTITDAYHEVKKESCLCVMKLAVAVPSHFHMQSERLIKPLLQTLGHQHSKVRVVTIKAIGIVIQYGNNKSIEDVRASLAQQLLSESSSVRLAITTIIGKWLCELHDRYSYFTKLIPIFLTSLTDEVPEIREEAQSLWEKAGKQYEEENESKHKDLLDFQREFPSHYPEGVQRPTVGCRLLVHQHFCNILPAVINDLGDWVETVRVKAAKLLYLLLLHMEENATMYLERILTKMAEISKDENKEVIKMISQSAELLGYFVKPNDWIKILLPTITSLPSAGNLLILSCLIKRSQKKLLESELDKVCNALAQSDVCRSFQVQEQLNLLSCVEAILNVCREGAKEFSLQLFTVLLMIKALIKIQTYDERIQEAMKNLATIDGLSSKDELYSLHAESILDQLQNNHELWGIHSPEFLMFFTLLSDTGMQFTHLLEKIMPLLLANLQDKKDPELRVKLFMLLSKLIMEADETVDLSNVMKTMISNIILPNLVWHAGRTATAIRTASVSFLWTLVLRNLVKASDVELVANDLFTSLISLLEDEAQTTRLFTCKILCKIIPILFPSVDERKIYNLYPEFLKRMDDVSDEIRITMTQVFKSYFDSFVNGYDVSLYSKHLEAVYGGLLLHMDDQNPEVQQAVLDLLIEISSLHPSKLLEEIAKVKERHRTQEYCDKLVNHINGLEIKE
ncbi:dynein assembly factor 5, axonemal-like [Centruroides sculpturatus]|uniref:dynein assembly factor 5, axonemal-like n=1 Tax=Centruroides sculpturatus TaxID=218467 RepID=UPI000C6EA927|nr:dynein assembly factor 5, axonemal-like [Centruroides sculpturatus]